MPAGAAALLDLLGAHAPFSPFVAQEPGARALLLAATGSFLIAAMRVRLDRRGAIGLAGVATGFLASLAMRAFTLPYLLATVLVTRRFAGDTAPDAAGRRALPSAIAALCALLLLSQAFRGAPASGPPSMPASAAVGYWLGRGNLFRARAAALEEAMAERTSPGEGYLRLATVDWDLGDREAARRVLAKVLNHGASPDLRRRAQALRDTWGQ